MKKLKIIVFNTALVLGIGLCSQSNAQVITVRPEIQVGVAPGPPPYAGAVWVAGEYRWDRAAGRYVVVDGQWVRPRRVGAAWVPGHWRPVRGGYIWVGGHWR